MSKIHKYIGFAIFSLCLAVWWRACTLDPGTIYPETVEQWTKVWQARRCRGTHGMYLVVCSAHDPLAFTDRTGAYIWLWSLKALLKSYLIRFRYMI